MIFTRKEHNSLLETRSRVTTIEECKDLKIFEQIEEEMAKSPIPAAGLSAIQIGIPVMAISIVTTKGTYNMINPVIKERIDPFVYTNEGCLSCPGESYNTDRFKQVTVEWLDYETGNIRKGVAYDTEAVAVQHECDHLEGILMYRREHRADKTGRNDPCPCGSGKKYKKCCLK